MGGRPPASLTASTLRSYGVNKKVNKSGLTPTPPHQDLAAMINAGIGLAQGLAAARTMFGQEFQPSESRKAMVYFEGGDLRTLPAADQETLIKAASAVRDLPRVDLIARELSIL